MSLHELDGHAVVAVGGEVDLSNADSLRDHLIQALEQRGPDLVLDLAELSFLDSSGVLALTTALRRAWDRGGSLRLAAPQRPVAKVLRVTDMWDLFGVFPSVEQACSSGPDRASGNPDHPSEN